jgi:hypothetical protein
MHQDVTGPGAVCPVAASPVASGELDRPRPPLFDPGAWASGPWQAYAGPLISHVSQIGRDSADLVRKNGVVHADLLR